jgi:5-(carboxyamino)imidazole ribonucleotide synthase
MTGWRPSATVGIVGGGQLARMTQQAAIDLGIELRILARDGEDAAASVSSSTAFGQPDSLTDVRQLAESCDVLTFDHELVPNRHLRQLQREGHDIQPQPGAKLLAQDKLHARELMRNAGFPVPEFTPVRSADDVESLAMRCGWPVVMKRRSGGYDGRGVCLVADRRAAEELGCDDGGWIAEALVPIELEVSQVVVRSRGGEVAAYPLVRTIQRDGICVETVAPAGVSPELADTCRDLAIEIAETIESVGVMAVELFLTPATEILVNELALRPHNTGHFTIEGCQTSQFENHLRAILGWPLGPTWPVAPAAAMRNLIGVGFEDPSERVGAALRVAGSHLHLYGKDPAPGRKLGHVTALAEDADEALRRCRETIEILQPEEVPWTP